MPASGAMTGSVQARPRRDALLTFNDVLAKARTRLMPRIVRLGDVSDRGGVVITAASHWFCEGPEIARSATSTRARSPIMA